MHFLFVVDNGCDDLALMIKQKQESRASAFDSYIDGLAEKYGGGPTKKSTKRKAPVKTDTTKKRKTRK